MDIEVRRNAYGRQVDSFQQEIALENGARETAVFIRAPKFLQWGSGVKVSGLVNHEPVFLESGQHMVTAFHPELLANHWFHAHFLRKISN